MEQSDLVELDVLRIGHRRCLCLYDEAVLNLDKINQDQRRGLYFAVTHLVALTCLGREAAVTFVLILDKVSLMKVLCVC